MAVAFFWNHKIVDAIHETADKVYPDGKVETGETFKPTTKKRNNREDNTNIK